MQNLAENPNTLIQKLDANYIYEQVNEENKKDPLSPASKNTESSVEDALHSIQLQHQAFKSSSNQAPNSTGQASTNPLALVTNSNLASGTTNPTSAGFTVEKYIMRNGRPQNQY